jgi:Cd2+/Zn2+-exporting ATPase
VYWIVRTGNLKLFEEDSNWLVSEQVAHQVEALEAEGQTTMVVQDGDRFLGIVGLAEQPRGIARPALQRLRSLSIKALVMLTSDNERVAAATAEVGA